MSRPKVLGKRRTFSDSNAMEAIAKALQEIKRDDDLTWADVGAFLGVNDETASHYGNAVTSMSAVTFGRGKREWNGRFTGYFDQLCEESRSYALTDRASVTNILAVATALSGALEDDEAIDAREVLEVRSELEAARDAIEYHLSKLGPRRGRVS